MDRQEVEDIAEGVVSLAIAKYHSENVTRLTRIEDRLIGIDGNGTGRKGAIQFLGDKIETIGDNVTLLLQESQQKEGARKNRAKNEVRLRWFLGVIGAGIFTLLGIYIKHKMGW